MATYGYGGYGPSAGGTTPMTPDQTAIASEFNPGAFGGGYGAMGPPTTQTTDNSVGSQVSDLNAIAGYYGPTMNLAEQLANQQIWGLAGQNYWTDQSLLNQQNQAQQSAMYQLGGLGLQGQSLGIQQGALARQLGLLPQQYGIQQQQFGLQGQQIDLSRQQAWQNAQQQQQGLASQLTASGNPYSVGGGVQRQNIQTGLANQLQGLNINQQQLGLQEQSAGLNYQEQLAQTQDAQKELGIQSQQLGMNESEVRSRLDSALNQLGIQSQVNSDQLLQATSQIKQGVITPLSGLIGLVSQITGLPLGSGLGGQ